MQSFNCAHCGKPIECEEGVLIAVCAHCGTEQAVPSPETNEAFFITADTPQTKEYKTFYEGVFGEDEEENEAYWEQVAQINRMFLLLADGDWAAAEALCDKLLQENPHNAEACFGKLMISLQVKEKTQLSSLSEPFNKHPQYLALLACNDTAVTQEVQGYLRAIAENQENKQQNSARYEEALQAMQQAYTENAFLKAAALFEKLGAFQDAAEQREECLRKAESSRKEERFAFAESKRHSRNAHDLEGALLALESIPDYPGADKLSEALQQRKTMLQQAQLKKAQLAEQKFLEKERLEAKKLKKRNILIASITTLVVMSLLAMVTVHFAVTLPLRNYEKALAAMQKGDTITAYETLITLGAYKDSKTLAASLYEDYKGAKLAGAKVGDTVIFGTCDQNNNAFDGKEEIEWIVAEHIDTHLLLLSKYALACRHFNDTNEEIVWENCSLRQWLNNDFITECFSEDQQQRILTTSVSADRNPDYDTDPGKATSDKVFLLSVEEVNRYFPDKSDRCCAATASARAQGSKTDAESGNTWWYLRTPGCEQIYITYVYLDGSIGTFGGGVNAANTSVRPAMWIDNSNLAEPAP